MPVSMVSFPVAGMTAQNGSNTPSLTGVWGAGQTRTAGNLLVAVVTTFGTTSGGTISNTGGTWGQVTEIVQSNGRSRVAFFTLKAAGGDAAPTFTATNAGTAATSRFTVSLFELTGQDGTTPVATFGGLGSGGGTCSIGTTGNVPAAGCFAIAGYVFESSTATTTVITNGASPWSGSSDQGTSARLHTSYDTYAGPPAGSVLNTSNSATGTINGSAGGLLVVQPPAGAALAITSTLPAAGTTGTPYGPAALTASGGAPGYYFGAASLPPGLALQQAIGNSSEGGTNAATITPANSGGASGQAWDSAVQGTGCAVVYDTAHAAHGSMATAIACGGTSALAYVEYSASIGASPQPQLWARFYMYLSALPSAAIRVWTLFGAAPTTNQRCFLRVTTAGKLALVDAASAVQWTQAGTLSTGAWMRVEVMAVGDASAGQFQCRIYALDGTTPAEDSGLLTGLALGGTIGAVAFGNGVASASVTRWWLDDMAVSNFGWLGPANVALPAPAVAGTPTTAGPYSVGLTVTDAAAATATATQPVTISAPITGTGAVAAKKIALAGAGAYSPPPVTGTGAVAAKKVALAGAGGYIAPVTGTGAVAAKKARLAGAGTFTPVPPVTGTGAVAAKKAKLAGAGLYAAPGATTGAGAIASKKAALAGAGTFTGLPPVTGTGAITAKKITLAGAGTYAAPPPPVTGTAAIASKKISLDGTGGPVVAPPPLVQATVAVAPAGPIPVLWGALSLNGGDGGDSGLTAVVTNVDGWYGSPPLAGNDLDRALTDGAVLGFKTIGARVITIAGAATGPRDQVNLFARQLAAKAVERAPDDLIIGEDDGSGQYDSLTASVRADSDSLSLAWQGRFYFTWQVVLTAPDPRLYEAEWQSAVLSPLLSTALTGRPYPLVPPRFYASSDVANTVRLVNPGSAPVGVWLAYTGPLGESRLSDGQNTIHLAPLGAAQQVLIASETLTATAPGGVSRASYLMPGSVPMVVPAYGEVSWSLYGTGTGSVSLTWRAAWA